MNFHIEFTCLSCEGQHVTNRHHCPHGLCSPVRHYDFCMRCRVLISTHLAKLMPADPVKAHKPFNPPRKN